MNLLDAVDQRPRRGNIVHGQIAVEPFHAEVALNLRMDEDRLQLRAEEQVTAALRNVQRLDANAIARQHQPAFGIRPQRDAKHAAQPAEAIRVPFQEGVQNGLGIAVADENVPQRFQLAAQLHVVVDFAVEDDGRCRRRGW